MLIYLFVCFQGYLQILDLVCIAGGVTASMLDIACCSFGSPWKYGLLQK